ncbi:MAG: Type I restriction-modification system, specificity subunit S [Candidatus Jettenia ecosi]|uniref:Type I restriction-modification system, specificity subunit S n=1 Tax=Candidatus Jettenia ecosi TaxID=2494326 RepID=A0A533Q5V2_9BACT|nr:MAG: Type I restriction-modification system, specificity subunit S [Candidatus Jettenia ecosi]
MQKLFTEGLRGEAQKEDITLKWDKVKLGSLAEMGIVEFQNGFPCGQWNELGVGIPQLRPFNVTDFGRIDLTQIKSIETNKSVEKYKLKQNDIVFNNTNSEELVGKTALWQNGDGYVLSNHMTIIRIKDDTSINSTYLANFLHKKWFDGHYKMVCRRHVNQASVSIERLKDMDLPYPPIDVQNEIAKSIISIDKKFEFANAKHKTLQVLFKSMLHHLMTGQIRVKDLKIF